MSAKPVLLIDPRPHAVSHYARNATDLRRVFGPDVGSDLLNSLCGRIRQHQDGSRIYGGAAGHREGVHQPRYVPPLPTSGSEVPGAGSDRPGAASETVPHLRNVGRAVRTPALIARALGWPEEHRAPDHAHYPLPATRRPKVIVWRTRPGHWGWVIGHRISVGMVEQDGPYGHAPTQPAALALGLAALDTASVRSKR